MNYNDYDEYDNDDYGNYRLIINSHLYLIYSVLYSVLPPSFVRSTPRQDFTDWVKNLSLSSCRLFTDYELRMETLVILTNKLEEQLGLNDPLVLGIREYLKVLELNLKALELRANVVNLQGWWTSSNSLKEDLEVLSRLHTLLNPDDTHITPPVEMLKATWLYAGGLKAALDRTLAPRLRVESLIRVYLITDMLKQSDSDRFLPFSPFFWRIQSIIYSTPWMHKLILGGRS